MLNGTPRPWEGEGGGGGEHIIFRESTAILVIFATVSEKQKAMLLLFTVGVAKITRYRKCIKQCYFQDRTSLVLVSFPHPLQGQVFGLGMRQGCTVTASFSYSSLPCPQISGRADRTALHYRRRTGQRHGMGARPSEEGLEWNSGNNGMT